MRTMRRGVSCLLAAVVCLQTACAIPVRPDHLARRDKRALGRVAVAAASFAPRYEFQALTSGKDDAAVKGGGEAALQCVEWLQHGADRVAVLFFLVCLPVSAAVGAVYGASTAASAEEVNTAKARLQDAIAALGMQAQTAHKALAYAAEMGLELGAAGRAAGSAMPDEAPAYREMADAADTLIEIGVAKITALSTGASEQQVAIRLEAQVRVVGARDGRPIDSLLVKEISALRPLGEWLQDGGRAIGEALDAAAAAIAEQAVDEILLVYHPETLPREQPEEDAPGGNTERVPPYTLRAFQPPIRNKVYLGRRMTYGHLERYPLDSLRPSFRWEAWPRGFDLVPGEAPGLARGLRYDFRLLDDAGVAYERRGLPAPQHRVEAALRPCETYRWTVRARFTLDGAPRATEWMGAYHTMAGAVAPWWWRRGSGVPALYLVPASVVSFYPIVETPSADGRPCPGR